MRTRQLIGDLLVHSQLFMAFSGVCFVYVISRLLVGVAPDFIWLWASATGILGLHLIDSVRSADHEDMISQPRRALLYREWRGPALIMSAFLLGLTGVLLLVAGARLWILICFCALGILAASYVFPLFTLFQSRRGQLASLKDLARLKPISISFAWLSGAFLVALAQPLDSGRPFPLVALLFLIVAAAPFLLLDSIWLDRRDRLADESYDRRTFAVRMSGASFRVVCMLLYLIPFMGLFGPVTGLQGFILGGMAGAALMVIFDPDQIGSEALRVVFAGLWRITSLLGFLLFLP